MDPYLARIARFPRLDAATEAGLARRAATGDSAARDMLITSQLPLVVAHARRLRFTGARLHDAVQAGSEGLIRAVDRFDPERGSRLSSYAWWWIADAMRTSDHEIPVAEVVATTAAHEPDTYANLHAIVQGLPAEDVDVLRERYGWDCTDGRRCTPRRPHSDSVSRQRRCARSKAGRWPASARGSPCLSPTR